MDVPREHIATYGLIGYPLFHSLSPRMHNAAFQALGVDAVYKLFPLKEDEFRPFLKELQNPENPIFGLNVTVPYKEKVMAHLDALSPFAQKTKAVNTIVISKDRKLSGFNTDGPGFLTHLRELKIPTEKRRFAIIGAGGAARALISVLSVIEKKPASIKVFDIDWQKCESLAKDLSQSLDFKHVQAVRSLDDLNIELVDVLINATPVGLKESDPSPIEFGLLHSNLFVYDLIYNPAETKLLRLAREKGAQTANGLGMLFYQGVLAFEHWAERELEEEIKSIMFKSLKEGLSCA